VWLNKKKTKIYFKNISENSHCAHVSAWINFSIDFEGRMIKRKKKRQKWHEMKFKMEIKQCIHSQNRILEYQNKV